MKKLLLVLIICLCLLPAGAAFAKDKVIVIGFTTSRTGKLSADAQPQRRGFEMWRDQVNGAGGITVDDERYKIKLVSYDDQSRPDRVQRLYSRLILQDGADFLLSPYSSDLTATAAVISEQYGKIMVTAGAAEGKTYKLGNRDLFQIYTPADRYLVSALRAVGARQPGAKVALAYSNDGFSRAAAEGALEAAGKMGLNVVFNHAYSPEATDFGPMLDEIAASGADVLLGGGYYADGRALAHQLYDKKMNLRFISLLGAPDNPEFAALGAAASGICVPSQWEPAVSYEPDFGPTPDEFTRQFKKKYGATPGYRAAGGYAAGLVLQHAIEQADSFKTDAVAKALNGMDAMTFYGRIRFSTDPVSHGLQIGHEMVLTQWQANGDGRPASKVVWPKTAASARIVYPLRR